MILLALVERACLLQAKVGVGHDKNLRARCLQFADETLDFAETQRRDSACKKQGAVAVRRLARSQSRESDNDEIPRLRPLAQGGGRLEDGVVAGLGVQQQRDVLRASLAEGVGDVARVRHGAAQGFGVSVHADDQRPRLAVGLDRTGVRRDQEAKAKDDKQKAEWTRKTSTRHFAPHAATAVNPAPARKSLAIGH